MGKSAEALSSSSIVSGLVLGIYLLTGVSIDPSDLYSMIGSAIAGTLPPQEQAVWGAVLVVLTIVGIWQIINLVVSLFAHKLPGIVISVTGFLGGLLLVFYPLPSVGLLFVSIAVAAILD